MPNRIFLSHKGANKPIVRLYHRALKAAGFQPWLDVEDMPVGTSLDHGIRQGFKEACAAIFFITPDFKDERFLQDEIVYAKEETRDKDGNFRIIVVIVPEMAHDGELFVPPLLRQYHRVQEADHLSSLARILEALSATTTHPAIPGQLHHVSLAVTDLERSIEFYRDVLGLELNPNRPRYLFEGAWFTLPSGQELHLVRSEHRRRSDDRATDPPYTENHLALRVRDIFAFERRILEKHEEQARKMVKDVTLPTRYEQRYLRDPDGNVVEINSDGPREPQDAWRSLTP